VSDTKYRVTRGTIQIPVAQGGGSIEQGCLVPKGVLDQKDIERLLGRGILEAIVVEAPSEQTFEGSDEQPPAGSQEPEREPAVTRGKWNVDPASIAEASLEDLLIRVNEIDPTVDLAELDEESARALLSSEFQPVFQEGVPEATGEQVAEVARRVAESAPDAGASE
jgi:hypothetical protein